MDAHILPLNFVYHESIANLLFDVRNRIAPSNIQDLFQDIPMFILTIHVLLPVITSTPKPSRLSVQANSFSRIGVKVWNAIPQALRNLSKKAFKRELKQILFIILGSQNSYIDLPEII